MKIKVLNIRLTKEYFDKDQEKVNSFLDSVIIKKSATALVEDKINYWSIIFHYTDKENDVLTNKNKITIDDLSSEQKDIFLALKKWRNSIAQERKLPAFAIFHNQTLIDIARNKLENIEELERIPGIGPSKLSKYGNDIIAILNAF